MKSRLRPFRCLSKAGTTCSGHPAVLRLGTVCPFVTCVHLSCSGRLLYSSVLSLLFLSGIFFFPGSVTVFPHCFMMKSLIVFEDLRKLLPCLLIFQALEWKLSLCH